MLCLHTMLPAYGLPTFTPFGLKVIAYLRMAGLPFRIQVEHMPDRGPKAKFPWLSDGDTVVADSGFILEYLADKYGARLDDGLTPGQQAQAHALRRMIEEGLCFCVMHTRWVDDAVFRHASGIILSNVPGGVRGLVRRLVRRRILRDLWGQGIARHTADEVARLGAQDLRALSAQLGAQPFVMGAQPTSVDATACAFLAVILEAPYDTSLKRVALGMPNLVAYNERMRKLCFSDAG